MAIRYLTEEEKPSTNGTHLQGYLDESYERLVEVFGEPNSEGDGYKVDAEWELMTPAGTATIYNYKSGENYLDDEGNPVETIRDWHIGGHTDEVVEHIEEALDN